MSAMSLSPKRRKLGTSSLALGHSDTNRGKKDLLVVVLPNKKRRCHKYDGVMESGAVGSTKECSEGYTKGVMSKEELPEESPEESSEEEIEETDEEGEIYRCSSGDQCFVHQGQVQAGRLPGGLNAVRPVWGGARHDPP